MIIIKQYSEEELINKLHEFVEIYGRVPVRRDMQLKGYPSHTTYKNYFGSWNNALEAANLSINKYSRNLTGNELCDMCNSPTTSNWYKIDDMYICSKCARSNRGYFNGNLDPTSTSGLGIIGEYIIHKTLNNSIWYNNDITNYNYKYDIYDNYYGFIDVKTSSLIHDYKWEFNLKFTHKVQLNRLPDHYFLIGFDTNKETILYVFAVPIDTELIKDRHVLTVTNSDKSIILNMLKKYEIDSAPFNEVYKNLNIHDIYHFRNLSNEIGDIIAE